jgi:hypothetical protein
VTNYSSQNGGIHENINVNELLEKGKCPIQPYRGSF